MPPATAVPPTPATTSIEERLAAIKAAVRAVLEEVRADLAQVRAG